MPKVTYLPNLPNYLFRVKCMFLCIISYAMIVSINLENYMILYDVTNEIPKQIKKIIQVLK
jgi:hypothetical protein